MSEKIKIVSWNCRYGFDGNKPEVINKFNADILIIPECRDMDMAKSGYDEKHRDWYGDHKEVEGLPEDVKKERDLGIGVFWKEGIIISPLPEWKNDLCKNSDFRYLVPYKVEKKLTSFILIAVWTKNKTDASDPLDYVQKAHAAVDHYKSIGLLDGQVILIGDFNSNSIWDKYYPKEKTHTKLVEKLNKIGINDCSRAMDKDKYYTYCYYHNGNEHHVIDDYCFASAKLSDSTKFIVSDSSEWKLENGINRWHGSDHCPISVEFDF
jgi:exonuclease III